MSATEQSGDVKGASEASAPAVPAVPAGFLAFSLVASLALAWGLSSGLAPKDLGLTPEAVAASAAAGSDALTTMRLRVVLGLAPLFGVLVSLFYPPMPAALRALGHRRVATIAAGLAMWTLLVPAVRFDPYWTVLVALWAAVPILALRVDPDPRRLTPLVLLVWLVWWIPFDLRWFNTVWTGPKIAYQAFALLVSVLACLAFGSLVRGGAPLELRGPSVRDAGVGVATLVVFGAIAIPVGIAIGFLRPTWPPQADLATAVLKAFGLAFTVALPEELYFRGVLDGGLRPLFRRAWTSLAVSSIAFGLMHWNNRPDKLKEQLAYFVLASVAGVFYGLAYRRSGLWAAVIAHTLVDLVWQLVLRGK